MIFKQDLVDQILAGNKTQTRRPVNFENPRSHYWHEGCRYRPGSKLTVQANYNGPAPARGVVTGLRRERWIDIGIEDAIAEGFPLPGDEKHGDPEARVAFFAYLQDLYPDLDPTAECWVVEFELVTETGGMA